MDGGRFAILLTECRIAAQPRQLGLGTTSREVAAEGGRGAGCVERGLVYTGDFFRSVQLDCSESDLPVVVDKRGAAASIGQSGPERKIGSSPSRLAVVPLLALGLAVYAAVSPARASAIQEPASAAQEARPVVRVGVVIDGPGAANDEIQALMWAQITALNGRDFDIRFPADKTLIGDCTVPTVVEMLTRQLADDDVDLVLAMGVMTSAAIGRYADIGKPSSRSVRCRVGAAGLSDVHGRDSRRAYRASERRGKPELCRPGLGLGARLCRVLTG